MIKCLRTAVGCEVAAGVFVEGSLRSCDVPEVRKIKTGAVAVRHYFRLAFAFFAFCAVKS
jgi:hypothetical protein